MSFDLKKQVAGSDIRNFGFLEYDVAIKNKKSDKMVLYRKTCLANLPIASQISFT